MAEFSYTTDPKLIAQEVRRLGGVAYHQFRKRVSSEVCKNPIKEWEDVTDRDWVAIDAMARCSIVLYQLDHLAEGVDPF